MDMSRVVRGRVIGRWMGGVALLAPALAAAIGAPRIDVSFVDPAAAYSAYYADLQRTTIAAGLAWSQHFAGDFSGVDLTVSINFAALATSTGRSLGSAFVGTLGSGMTLWEQGAAHELRTGVDINGALPDIEFSIGAFGYLQSELWFDPDPWLRSAAVPADRTDAMSVLLHEWGHALGFNGWMDGSTGALPGSYASTYDAQIVPQSGPGGMTLVFQGAQAMSLYGAAVPLTFGNYAHVGNSDGRGGADLIPDLMNGEVFYRGTRYQISALDLAMLADVGLPVVGVVPEPGKNAMLLAGLGVVVFAVIRRRPGR